MIGSYSAMERYEWVLHTQSLIRAANGTVKFVPFEKCAYSPFADIDLQISCHQQSPNKLQRQTFDLRESVRNV